MSDETPARILFLLAAFWVAVALACAPAARADEAPGTALLKKVQAQLRAGNELKACRLALGFKEYEDSPVYPKAKAYLLEQGISIDDPLSSYTVKRIIELENRLEAQRARSGAIPRTGYRQKYLDGWGNPLRVELVTRRGFAYLIRSAGPDRKFMTGDDSVVGIRADNVSMEEDRQQLDPARAAGRRSLMRRQQMGAGGGAAGGFRSSTSRSPSPSGAKGASSGEVEVKIEDLLKK